MKIHTQYDYLLAHRATVAEFTKGASTVDDSAAGELARQVR